MTYKCKGGGPRQVELRKMLAEHRQPLETWWIAEQRGEDLRRVLKSLNRLRVRGVVQRHGTRRNYAWSLAAPA